MIYQVDALIRELAAWAMENPLSATLIAFVVMYTVFRSLGLKRVSS